jgi:crotonobetainyl-CoA:carnitine CoA-transferase CaiB-like acyl-CoA transferase
MPTLFDGVRVLSLAEQYPGPYATLLLADLGADVVLVERPKGGDPARAWPPVFRSLARNKRSVCLDLKTAEGAEQLRALVTEADVLLEGFRPGTMDRLGVGYEALRAVNPKIIFVSLSGFGQDGPYRDRTAHDLSYQAISGHLVDGGAVPAVAYGDLGSGTFAAFAIASALFARERTGEGTAIDVSMADGLVSWMTAYLSPAMSGEPAFTILGEPAYGIFATKDGRKLTVSIAHEDHFWRALCGLLAMEDVAPLQHHARLERAAELEARLAAALAAEPLAHWAELFDRHAIPWSPLHDLPQVLADPHFRARGMFASVPGEVGERGEAVGHVMQPVRFSRWESALRRPSPRLGEHTAEVLAEWRDVATRHPTNRSSR